MSLWRYCLAALLLLVCCIVICCGRGQGPRAATAAAGADARPRSVRLQRVPAGEFVASTQPSGNGDGRNAYIGSAGGCDFVEHGLDEKGQLTVFWTYLAELPEKRSSPFAKLTDRPGFSRVSVNEFMDGDAAECNPMHCAWRLAVTPHAAYLMDWRMRPLLGSQYLVFWTPTAEFSAEQLEKLRNPAPVSTPEP